MRSGNRRATFGCRGMLRRLQAGVLAVVVPTGAVCAPLLHAHLDEDADHHQSTSVHAHFTGHPLSHAAHHGVSVDTPDHDRVIYLQLFVAVEPALSEVPALVPTLFDFVAPAERSAHSTVTVAHGHDPPDAAALDSRPPPFLPVLI